MKLLFDENVSPKLPRMLAHEYPGSVHVREAGLRGVGDGEIWDYGRAQCLAIISTDVDFRERSFVEGFPPKDGGAPDVHRMRASGRIFFVAVNFRRAQGANDFA